MLYPSKLQEGGASHNFFIYLSPTCVVAVLKYFSYAY